MSTSSSTQSAMYHGADFWKIVAWVKDELAARLNSFVCRWDSSSKTVRLTIGRGVFPIGASQPKGGGLDRHQRRRVLFGCSQVTSHRECGLSTGIRIRHYLLRFGLLHSDVPRRIPICLTEADSFSSARRAAFPPFAVFRLRPVLPPGTGRSSSGPSGNGAGSDRHEALQSTSVGSPVVEHKTDGDSPQRPSVSQSFR